MIICYSAFSESSYLIFPYIIVRCRRLNKVQTSLLNKKGARRLKGRKKSNETVQNEAGCGRMSVAWEVGERTEGRKWGRRKRGRRDGGRIEGGGSGWCWGVGEACGCSRGIDRGTFRRFGDFSSVLGCLHWFSPYCMYFQSFTAGTLKPPLSTPMFWSNTYVWECVGWCWP